MYALDQFLAMTRMRQKLMQREMVQNAAKVTALQRAGESDKEGINKVRSEPKVFENKRVSEANSELAKKKAAAEVEAAKAVAAELQGEVEKMNALTTNEKLKAGFLSKASAQYETKVQEANWELYKKQKEAEAALFERKAEVEATLFEKKAEAEAHIALADATLYARKQEAEADLYAKKKEAEGIVTIGQAQGVYISTLLKACCHEERGM